MEEELMLDRKNLITMKLLHYFITEKNYNPIILQGVENEIWLENLEEDCKVVRIVSNYIHNNEHLVNKKFIPMDFLENNRTIIVMDLKQWLDIFNNLNNVSAFLVVIFKISSVETPFISANFSATYKMSAELLVLPLYGSGAI